MARSKSGIDALSNEIHGRSSYLRCSNRSCHANTDGYCEGVFADPNECGRR